jgi:hypothetical protein
MKWFLETWWTIIVRPIYFYTKLKEEDWKEKALTFLLMNCGILAAVGSLVIFIIQYITIGRTLVEGVAGIKFLIVLPVLITLAFVFFLITLLILGGILVLNFFVVFYLIGILLHYVYLMLGGKGSRNRMLQSSFYSSAVILAGIFVFLLMILTKHGGLEFALFRAGYNLIYFLVALYVYGLWAVAGRKTYGVPRWKAFAGALVPLILLLIFGILFDKIALSKFQPWIT